MDLYCELSHALRSVDGSLSGVVDTALATAGRNRHVTLALPHFHAVAVAVSKSGLIAALPRQTAEDTAPGLGLALFLPPVEMERQRLRLYWHRRHDRSPAHKWFREQVLNTIRELDGPRP
jgi:DNA-binding transcriptional LysR family regulator